MLASSTVVGHAAENSSGERLGGTPTTVVTKASGGKPPARAPHAATPLEGPLDKLISRAANTFGNEFAGVANTDAGPTVFVRQREPIASQLPSLFDGAQVRHVGFSFVELRSAQSRLDVVEPLLKSRGITLESWGVNVATNALDVGVVLSGGQTLDAVAGALAEVLDGIPFNLTAVSGLNQPARTADPAPHWGGANITRQDGGGSCTSGIYWSNGAMMTAAHCGGFGTQWDASLGGYFGQTTWDGLQLGGSSRIDVAAINPNGGGQGYFYVGGPFSQGGVHVDFYYDSTQAGVSGLRTSGANGEAFVSPGNVTQTDISINTPFGTVYHINRAKCATQPGDSGGPVFSVNPTGSIIVAGIIYGQTDSTTCNYTRVQTITNIYGGVPSG